jgi:hypothetical protein
MYNTETSNSDRIWTSRDLNIDFRPIFIMNRCFLVKPKANPLWVMSQNMIFFKTPKYVYTYRGLYVAEIQFSDQFLS